VTIFMAVISRLLFSGDGRLSGRFVWEAYFNCMNSVEGIYAAANRF
jgi:hypothetical protein